LADWKVTETVDKKLACVVPVALEICNGSFFEDKGNMYGIGVLL